MKKTDIKETVCIHLELSVQEFNTLCQSLAIAANQTADVFKYEDLLNAMVKKDDLNG